MFKVVCPVCKEERVVRARKPWMVGDEPYTKPCKKHAGGKEKSEDHRKRLSEAVKKAQTKEVLEQKRQFMLDHPELWVKPRPDLAKEAWQGQHHTEESKRKIGEGVRKAKGGGNEQV
jgi:hypothetical protein